MESKAQGCPGGEGPVVYRALESMRRGGRMDGIVRAQVIFKLNASEDKAIDVGSGSAIMERGMKPSTRYHFQ